MWRRLLAMLEIGLDVAAPEEPITLLSALSWNATLVTESAQPSDGKPRYTSGLRDAQQIVRPIHEIM